MKYEIEQKLLNAGLENGIYERETWYEIINAMTDDFQKLIGCNFERDKNNDMDLDLDRPLRVSVNIFMWTPEDNEQSNCTPTQAWLDIINHDQLKIKDTHSRSLIKWYGHIWGDMDEQQEECKSQRFRNLFYADSTLFLFDPLSGKRLYLETGESLVEFHFQRNPQGGSKWVSLGWANDIYGEWEHLEHWE